MSVKEKASGYSKGGTTKMAPSAQAQAQAASNPLGYAGWMQTAASSAVDVGSLAGQGDNPWPPNADSYHLEYDGGDGLGIWNQFGGGVANGGVNSQTAKDMNNAVKGYTDGDYGDMRDAFEAGDTTSYFGKQAQTVQAFIEKGIETGNGWNSGPTYRGIGDLPNSTWKAYTSLKAGDSIDCNLSAPASWSTNRQTSEYFGGSHNHITFVHLGTSQNGVSVDKISSCSGENEVLVSGKQKYKVVAVSPTEYGNFGASQTYIYVEDAN